MWISVYLEILASVVAITTAAPHILGVPDSPYISSITSYPTYPAYPIDYSPHHLFGSYNYFTGPEASHIESFPHYFYPGFENSGVEIARKKDSSSKDPKVPNKKNEKEDKTKEPCITIQDPFGTPGLPHIYSFDNGPHYLKSGYDFNIIPSVASWPFGFDYFGPLHKLGAGIGAKDEVLKKGSKKGDDDIAPIDRQVSIKVPGQKPQDDVPGTTDAPDAAADTGAPKNPDDTIRVELPAYDNASDENDENKTGPPSTDAPSTSSDDAAPIGNGGDAVSSVNGKRKRQSEKVEEEKKV